ncbi:MAG: hypothetical protein HQL50_14215 [Magnetococcales bacterium]|nr:hypothetical protein [Magnetococcales bacterium]
MVVRNVVRGGRGGPEGLVWASGGEFRPLFSTLHSLLLLLCFLRFDDDDDDVRAEWRCNGLTERGQWLTR